MFVEPEGAQELLIVIGLSVAIIELNVHLGVDVAVLRVVIVAFSFPFFKITVSPAEKP